MPVLSARNKVYHKISAIRFYNNEKRTRTKTRKMTSWQTDIIKLNFWSTGTGYLVQPERPHVWRSICWQLLHMGLPPHKCIPDLMDLSPTSFPTPLLVLTKQWSFELEKTSVCKTIPCWWVRLETTAWWRHLRPPRTAKLNWRQRCSSDLVYNQSPTVLCPEILYNVNTIISTSLHTQSILQK